MRIRNTDYDRDKYPQSALTERIIGCAINVHKSLGPGFKESAYENALLVEFDEKNIRYERQKPVSIKYRGKKVGRYRIDLVVEDRVIVELKATNCIRTDDGKRLLSYLKATGLRIGLLMNFAKPTIGIKRMVL